MRSLPDCAKFVATPAYAPAATRAARVEQALAAAAAARGGTAKSNATTAPPTKGLNVVESLNGADAVIYCGNGGEIASNRHDEQEMTMLYLRIRQAALVYVNSVL